MEPKRMQYTPGEKMDSFMNLLQKLGLSDFYPKKMTKLDVLAINSLSLSITEPTTEKDLSNLYLYKLITLDYQARYLCVKPEEVSTSLNNDGPIAEDEDLFALLNDTSIQTVSVNQDQIHPMDIHLAILHCTNDFLRQYIFTKLSTCQFGLPILIPNPCTDEVEFPLWAFRHINKSWTCKNGPTSGKYINRQMCNTPVSTVSFIRLGSSKSTSKSQILNDVISKQKHSVFFHRHCKGSTPDSLLMNGVVEVAWYCPGWKQDDKFDDCVAFMNLRGNAADHPKQFEFLQAVSAVNVLLISEDSLSEPEKHLLQKLLESPIPLICLLSGKQHIQQSNNPRKPRLAAKNRNQSELTDELTSQIKKCISLNKLTMSIEGCCESARKQQLKVDEDQKSCQDAYKQAKKLTDFLKAGEMSAVKERYLPLQGKLWHDWCIEDKERHRLVVNSKESLEEQKSNICKKMDSIRAKQREICTPLNAFMKLFLESFTPAGDFEDTISYILQWLRFLLGELSTDALSKLEEDYRSTWGKIRQAQKDKEQAPQVSKLETELNGISQKMTMITVGLTHVMREVGQIYEATEMSGKPKKKAEQNLSSLPDIGVKMLLSGYPLELMDGDASHVPLKWIEAVLQKLTKECRDKKLLVLSILGLQSSGKSTLLNAMFGVQFPVSAGRCTRGASMQLIPVDSSIRNQLGYDFILIVDTEGLRSPELSTNQSVSRDNEIATFIIGIGDLTVINIMGENPSEMQDILQICVQAFLRMKMVKISPSCIFVHQNCAEAADGDKTMEGRRCLLEKLDHIAEMAAKEEDIEGISGFSDVINFDIDTQVFYFKGLLEGDPPMAPPNPSYSQNVQELKSKLLTVAEWLPDHSFSSFSEFRLRVGDLWKALLQENFVFSFRNTVEIMVYNSLETKYSEWSLELRKSALELQSKLHNQIASKLIHEVNEDDLQKDFDKVYNPQQCIIEKYFNEAKNKETLTQWRVTINNQFESLRTELIDDTRKKCEKLLTSQKKRSELDQKQTEYTDELTKKSKALASKLKERGLKEEQVNEEFNKLWSDWEHKIRKAQPTEENINVKALVENALRREFNTQRNILEEILKGSVFEFKPKDHIQQGFFGKWLGKRNFKSDFEKLQQQLMNNMKNYITAKEDDKEDFDRHFIFELLSEFKENITTYEKENDLKFTNAFRVQISVHLCLKGVSKFQEMHNNFKTENNPVTYLNRLRDGYLKSFLNYCKGAQSVTIFADFFCEYIKPRVLKAVHQNVSQLIAYDLVKSPNVLSGSRADLEKQILKDLAQKEDFHSYEEYIDSPQEYFEKFITENVEKFCGDLENVRAKHRAELEILTNTIITECSVVTTEVHKNNGNASTWLTYTCRKLANHITIKREEFHSIEREQIEDWKFLKDTMSKSLEEMIKDENEIDMYALKKDCTDIVLKEKPGCWEKCPFCKAICTNGIPNHKDNHNVSLHRPQALSGMYWLGTVDLAIEFCTTEISSTNTFIPCGSSESVPFSTYKKAGPPYDSWDITCDLSEQSYWKWFICKFQKQWEERKKRRFAGKGKIPEGWKNITKESALKEL